MSTGNSDFLLGFAAAIATLAKEYDQPTIAGLIIYTNSLTPNDFNGLDLTDYDRAGLDLALADGPRCTKCGEILWAHRCKGRIQKINR